MTWWRETETRGNKDEASAVRHMYKSDLYAL